MGKPVTVDSDDLEALLFATAAIKKIEEALRSVKDDPMVKLQKVSLRDAHDRLATSWRNGTRVNEDPIYDAPLRLAEVKVLQTLVRQPALPQNSVDPTLLSDLRRKMMVEMGTLYKISAAKWGNKQEEDRKVMNEQLVLRITQRGRDAIAGLSLELGHSEMNLIELKE